MMQRDIRLLLAFLLLIVSAVLFKLEIDHEAYYAKGFWTGDWAEYGQRYGIDISRSKTTIDWTPGYSIGPLVVAIGSFVVALVLIMIAWWKPKK